MRRLVCGLSIALIESIATFEGDRFDLTIRFDPMRRLSVAGLGGTDGSEFSESLLLLDGGVVHEAASNCGKTNGLFKTAWNGVLFPFKPS